MASDKSNTANTSQSETLESLTKEAASLKAKLEEERQKLNDVARMYLMLWIFWVPLQFCHSKFDSGDCGREDREHDGSQHQASSAAERTSGQGSLLGLVPGQETHCFLFAGLKAIHFSLTKQ
jgi:hypothetical protein